ncbi:MAG TPA: PQQ-binding-like beta-propeller repeat protein [Planctomycetota bacterium]|nr:PQQ-binding-like beta-propeller repeat protein [Planctomycetota bacterium]
MRHLKTLGRVLFLLSLAAASPALLAQAGKKEVSAGVPDWGMYRGPKRDGLSPDTGLLKEWPASGPPLAWKATGLGLGYSSVSIVGNRLFTMGDVDKSCTLIALNLADGKTVWKLPIAPSAGVDRPGSRSTPASDGKMVFCLTPSGQLACADAATGRLLWKKDLGGKMMSGWGFSESPLLDGPLVVVTPGGDGGTVEAFDKVAGKTVWQSKELKDKAAYSSLVPIELGGIRQYVVFTDQSVAGIAAKTGQVVWRAAREGKTAVIPTPVYKDGFLFVTSGYDVGHNGFQITGTGGKFQATEVYKGKVIVHTGAIVLVDDHVYAQTDSGQLKCIELKTGKEAWSGASVPGKGTVCYADGHLIIRNEKGAVSLVEASPAAYKEVGRFNSERVGGEQGWAHPVVFGGKLYIRDWDALTCYDLQAK